MERNEYMETVETFARTVQPALSCLGAAQRLADDHGSPETADDIRQAMDILRTLSKHLAAVPETLGS